MCLPKQTEILFSCDMVCCEQIISVHRHGRTHRHMHTSLSSECRDNHARSEFSYPPTPESFCSREQKTRAPHLLSSHLCLLPRNCHESSVYMNVCVCVHMCACQSEVACRLSFVGSSIAIFWWLCVIQCQKETLRVSLNRVQYSMCASYHAAVFLHFFCRYVSEWGFVCL